MARTGKIARLPLKIREELNHRLLDGQSGAKILPWLNALPEVIARLEEDFEGLRINDQNLSDWRLGGFVDWQQSRQRIERTKELATYAAQHSKAAGASITEGAQAIASGKLLELLETLDEAIEKSAGEKDDPKQLSADALVAIAGALGSLRTSEQNDVRLAQNEKKLAQKDEELALAREKYQRETCALFIKWHTEKTALDVANSESTNADKIERLGQLMFGETWKPAP